MTIRSCVSRLGLLIVGLAWMLPQGAAADTESCTQAHAAGQREENAGHLKEALTHFQECAADAQCPLPIRNECTSLYSTVEGRLPTLVFSVVDANGNDVTNVRVSSADAQVANGLDGRPVAINPGLHELRFELPGGEILTKSVVVRQGEKDRIVAVKLPRTEFGANAPAAAAEPRSEQPVAASPAVDDKRLTVPLASWISYGVGAAALVSWGTFALLGRNQEQGLVDCSPNCASTRRDDYDAMKRDYLIADISLGVAAAAVVTGTVLLFTLGRRSRGSEDGATAGGTTRSISLSPVAVGQVGGGLLVRGRY
jgi:hypothetical protein